MTINDVANLIIPEQFGCGNSMEIIDEDAIFEQLDDSVDTAWGASKFVILFDDAVVKIPFNGSFYWDEDDDYEGGGEYTFDEFHNKNYCETEAAVYTDAITAGVELFFASTKFAGMTKDNTPYYISERVYDFYDDNNDEIKTPSKDSREKAERARDIFDSELDEMWLALAYEWYGDAAVQQLLNFIKEEHISDLHLGNIGFRKNGAPVILDYSSFDE